MNDGGQAYPRHHGDQHVGASKLEWYAKAAMQGIVAGNTYHGRELREPGMLSKQAFAIAQAMIEAHERIVAQAEEK